MQAGGRVKFPLPLGVVIPSLLLLLLLLWLCVSLTLSPTSLHDETTFLARQSDDSTTQIILVSSWRSGSSFSFDLIGSHPDVFALYEPLAGHDIEFTKLRSWSSIPGTKEYVRNLLLCNFNEPGTEIHLRKQGYVLKLSKIDDECKALNLSCTGEHISSVCLQYPITLLKFVRLPVALTADLLADPTLPNVHVVYVPRDPRAVMSARWVTKKIVKCNDIDCASSRNLCQDMADDLEKMKQLQQRFPGRVHYLRYEDLALDPPTNAKKLFANLGVYYDNKVNEFIQSHTTADGENIAKTQRVSSERVMAWSRELAWNRVEIVQDHCSAVMEKFGYIVAPTPFNLTLQDVLKLDSTN